jgi:signal transduction histidine kinase
MTPPSVNILVVEDSPCDAELFCHMLSRNWSEACPVAVPRLRDAFAILKERYIDAILLDLTLPDSAELDTLRAIRKRAAAIPVVVLTGSDDESQGVHAVKMGAQDYLSKGTTTAEMLVRCIKYAIERKRLEEEVRQRVDEVARLSRVMMMETMISTLVHDLKQPITAITAYADAAMIRIGCGNLDTDQLLTNMQAIAQQARHVDHVVSRVRRFVSRSDPMPESVSINELLPNALALIEAEARRQRIDFQLQLAPDPPEVFIDRVQIIQVLLNLMHNAIEAIDSMATTQRVIRISTDATDDSHVAVSVEDTGRGFDPLIRDTMFDPFISTKDAGMGMGLAISRSIVASHGGTMAAIENVNGGATFVVRLPIATRDEALSAIQQP